MFMNAAESFVISDKIVLPWAISTLLAPAMRGGVLATTQVETAAGWQAAGGLARGALIHTWEGGLRAVSRVERTLIGACTSLVHVPGGAFGNCADVELSPDQGLLVSSRLVEDLFDEGAVVVPAKALVGFCGIGLRTTDRALEMIRLGFDDEEGIFVSSGMMVHCPQVEGGNDFFRSLSGEECATLLSLMADEAPKLAA